MSNHSTSGEVAQAAATSSVSSSEMDQKIQQKAEAIAKIIFKSVEVKTGNTFSPEAGRSQTVSKSASQSLG